MAYSEFNEQVCKHLPLLRLVRQIVLGLVYPWWAEADRVSDQV